MTMILNPNEKIVNAIKKRLEITNGQCPCISEDEWTEDTLCPCKVFRENQYCCCCLYVKSENKENKND